MTSTLRARCRALRSRGGIAALGAVLALAARPVAAQIFQITTTTLPTATIGAAYTARIDSINGAGPFTWTYSVGDHGTICDDPATYGLTLATPTTTEHTTLAGHVPITAPAGSATFCIGAVTATGATPIQTITMAVQHPAGPLPPQAIDLADVNGHDVTLRWPSPPSEPTPVTYLVEGGPTPTTMIGAVRVAASRPALTVTLPDGTWFFRVSSETAAGTSAPSAPRSVALGTNAFPSAPTGLIGLVSGGRVALSWTPAFDAGAPAGTVIDVSGTLNGLVPVAGVHGWQFDGVPPGTYAVSVRSQTAAGVGAASAPITVSVPSACAGSPGSPRDVLAYHAAGRLHVLWNPPIVGTAVERYVVTLAGPLAGTFDVGPQRVHAVAMPPGSYALSVTAVNTCGVSAPTAAVTVVVP